MRKNKRPIIGLSVLIVCAGIFGLYLLTSSTTGKDANVVTNAIAEPSETKPANDYKWQGGPSDPKKIIIPKISVDSYVQQVGLDANKQIAVPDNLYIVGWFVGSAKPGEKGLSVIDGHVTGRKNDGVFKNLNTLQPGDIFSVQFGNNSVKKFRVIGKSSVPEKESLGMIFSQDSKVASQLNLVTCSGEFDEKTRSYSERLTVSSELVN